MHCLTLSLLAFFLTSLSVTGWQIYVMVDYKNHNREITCNVTTCKVIGIGHCFNSNCYEILMTYSAIINGITYKSISLFSISGDGICDHNTTKCYYNDYKPQKTFSLSYPFSEVWLILLFIILSSISLFSLIVWGSYSNKELVQEYPSYGTI
jgi:hypothetical protein